MGKIIESYMLIQFTCEIIKFYSQCCRWRAISSDNNAQIESINTHGLRLCGKCCNFLVFDLNNFYFRTKLLRCDSCLIFAVHTAGFFLFNLIIYSLIMDHVCSYCYHSHHHHRRSRDNYCLLRKIIYLFMTMMQLH